MTKKEEFEKFLIENGWIVYWSDESDKLWSWIQNELRQAKIEENKRYVDTGIPPFDSFKPTFVARISELEKED